MVLLPVTTRQHLFPSSARQTCHSMSLWEQEAISRFVGLKTGDLSIVPADLTATVAETVVRAGGVEEWEAMLDFYTKATFAEDKVVFLGALGATKHPDLIRRALQLSLSPAVRSQDASTLLLSISRTLLGTDLVWKFVTEVLFSSLSSF